MATASQIPPSTNHIWYLGQHFSSLYSSYHPVSNFTLINMMIYPIFSSADNDFLVATPSNKKIKDTVFSMDP